MWGEGGVVVTRCQAVVSTNRPTDACCHCHNVPVVMSFGFFLFVRLPLAANEAKVTGVDATTNRG